MPSMDNAQAHESKLYYELSHFYDRVFNRVFGPRIHRVIQSLHIEAGAKVLEVGVGTGVSLEAYPTHCQVTGIDLAPEMLDQAREKIRLQGLRHVKVAEMDALDLKFEDNRFDYVMGFHVVSVVPDAAKLMREMQRVAKPGATIVIINHFRSQNPLLAAIDNLSEPITRKLGWHTLDLEEILAPITCKVEQLYKTSARSLFTIMVGKVEKPAPAAK